MTTPSDTTSHQELLDELAKLRLRIAELEDSEHKRRISEEALHRSEAKYKQLVELLPQVVYEIDAHGAFVFMNCAGLASFGYEAEDLEKGIKALDLVIPEDRERLARNLGWVMKREKLAGIEYIGLRKDGSRFPMLTYSHPIVRDNNVVGTRGIGIDITDLRQAQQRLWVKDSAVASSINAIALADLEGNLTYVNPSFLKLWEYQRGKRGRGD
jgi:PAS domain S-box-containing protein